MEYSLCGLYGDLRGDTSGAHYDIDVSVRGLRNNMDYNYEENISEVNKLINSELETVYLRADTKTISSSMVKELLAYHQDVKQLVPESVYNILN